VNHSRTSIATYSAILCILLLLNQSLASASPAPQPQSALPSQIRTAHSIFLANAGAQTGFPYDPSVAYQQFADDLQAWGRFTLAATPSEADLIFELRSAAPVGSVVVNQGTGGSYRLPELQLTIIDPHTQTRLWVLSEPVYQTRSRKDKTDWFTVSVSNLTTRVKQLDGEPLTSTESAELERAPKPGHHAWVYAVVATPVVLGVVGGIILHHEYENSLANQKASQDAFCQANNIPLSECAGG
jgi:hypothetical protein